MQTAVVVVVALLLPLSALLRLGCLATATATADADANRTTSGNDTSCAPARCGGLNITYPFSLAGVHPLECGYPAFGLTCDAAAGRAYLSRTFRVNLYRVLSISYDNRSMLVAVETAFSGDGACRIPDFNVSSGLGILHGQHQRHQQGRPHLRLQLQDSSQRAADRAMCQARSWGLHLREAGRRGEQPAAVGSGELQLRERAGARVPRWDEPDS